MIGRYNKLLPYFTLAALVIISGCAQPEQVPIRVIELGESYIIRAEAIVEIILIPDRNTRKRFFWRHAIPASNHVLIDKPTWKRIKQRMKELGILR